VACRHIYANEALFRSGITPTPARRIGLERCKLLARNIKKTLESAIVAGGSSLRDYVGSDGLAGNSRASSWSMAGRKTVPALRHENPEIRQGSARRTTVRDARIGHAAECN